MLNPLITHSKKLLTADDVVKIRHNLMLVYGWIPLKDFKEILLPELWDLNHLAVKEVGKRENLRLCSLKFYGVKNPK